MMRITNSMIVTQFLSDANSSLNRVSKYQKQTESTKRISSIADDPLATIRALKARTKISSLEVYQGNISTATSYLTEVEGATSSLDELIQSAYESMGSANSGSKSQDELDVIAKNMENLRDEVLSIANSTMGSSYLFGGHNFTGSTNGVSKDAPFRTAGNGDLLYNDVNLSAFFRVEKYEDNTKLMEDLGNSISTLIPGLDTATDYDAKENITANILDSLKDMKVAGENALYNAKQEGLSGTEFVDFENLVKKVSDVYDALSNECSKELAENGGGTNSFSITNCKNILAGFTTAIGTGGQTLKDTADLLGGKFGVTPADRAALAVQEQAGTTLQIGVSQTVDVTVNGIELLGKGRDNLYCILDQCVSMLKGDLDQSQMTKMITTLQNKQSDVLSLQTDIGSTQNRLNTIDNRYTASKITYKKMQSDAEDADMAESITNLTTAKTAYNAALAAGAKIIQTSLIDYLR